jgi:hypothetical protein
MKSERIKSFMRILLVSMMLPLVFACAYEKVDESFISEPFVRERWLTYLADGKTARSEIIRRLGEPTSSFQDGTILGYRLILIEGGQDLSEKEYRSILINLDAAYIGGYYGWVDNRRKVLSEKGTLFTVTEQNKEEKLLEILSREAEFSLVLVFDDQGTLARHSLRRIMP